MKLLLSGFLVCAVLLLGGCGSGSEYGDVAGIVTLDGKPLENAFIVFSPTTAGAGTVAYGKTTVSGAYVLRISDAHSGILPGEYDVDIHTTDVMVTDQGQQKWLPERVPPKYNKKTELKSMKVVAGESHSFDFDLTGERKSAAD